MHVFYAGNQSMRGPPFSNVPTSDPSSLVLSGSAISLTALINLRKQNYHRFWRVIMEQKGHPGS